MKNFLKTTFVLTFLLTAISVGARELNYFDASKLTVVGKAFETPNVYHRVDTVKYNDMPAAVKKLYTNPAGVAIAFKTNSSIVSVKWSTPARSILPNMTPIAQQGLDMYIKKDGVWTYAGVGRPSPGKLDHEDVVVKNMAAGTKECLLYLPLFYDLKSLEIGVDEGAIVEAIPSPFSRRIALYGSSIAHGASASRSGMNYPSILSRRTGLDFINLGLSGNAKMEIEVARMLADINPDMYILDCIPNPTAQQIRERMIPFVKLLRESHPSTPIIIIQSLVRETTIFNQGIRKVEAEKLAATKEQVEKLLAEKVTDLYFIDEDEFLGTDHNATVDGVHPNDLGFDRMLQKIEPQIRKILRKYNVK